MTQYDQNVILLIFGCLEIMRRNIWNIFRMENEQVNNCGKFRYVRLGIVTDRATIDVPFPFPDLQCHVCYKHALITIVQNSQ